jgi:hypothetical protein
MNHTTRYQTTSVSIRQDLLAELKHQERVRGKSMDQILNEALQSHLRHTSRSSALTLPLDANAFATPARATQPPLYLHFRNTLHIINKPSFLIGREPECDLFIPDSNISRHHCKVLYEDGEYKICDLKSTNGVEFQGQKLHWRHISEGDEFFLCEFKISFTFKQP